MAVPKSAVIIALVVGVMLVSAVLLSLVFPLPLAQVGQTSEQEIIDQLWRDGENEDLFGPLSYSGGTVAGKYIEFGYSEDDGVMSDVRINTTDGLTTAFDGVAVTGLGSTAPTVDGPLFQVEGPEATLLVHNNPTALIQIGAAGAGVEVVLSLPDGTEVVRNTEMQAPSYNLSVDGVELWMGAVNADVREDDNEMRITFTDAGAMLIRQLPQFENVGDDEEREVMHATDSGFIGGEVWVLARPDGYVQEYAALNGAEIGVASADVGTVTLEVSSEFEGGYIVLVNVDRTTIDPDDEGAVTVDGEDVPNVGLDGVLDAAWNNDPDPSYAMLEGDRTTKFLIYLPDLTAGVEVTIENL